MRSSYESSIFSSISHKVSDSQLLNKSQAVLVVNSCRCQSAWCPVCRASRFPRLFSRRIKSGNFDFQHTRMITLTLSRDYWKDGWFAWEKITKEKRIFKFLRLLDREREIKDWLWVLEWHADGFPHWHILITFADIGMVGGGVLRDLWKDALGLPLLSRWGVKCDDRILESYFRDSSHWNRVVGYFSTAGYFSSEKKDKTHQLTLPEWAFAMTSGSIRKWSAMHLGSASSSAGAQSDPGASSSAGAQSDRGDSASRRSYSDLFGWCGSQCLARVYYVPSDAVDFLSDVHIVKECGQIAGISNHVSVRDFCRHAPYVFRFDGYFRLHTALSDIPLLSWNDAFQGFATEFDSYFDCLDFILRFMPEKVGSSDVYMDDDFEAVPF